MKIFYTAQLPGLVLGICEMMKEKVPTPAEWRNLTQGGLNYHGEKFYFYDGYYNYFLLRWSPAVDSSVGRAGDCRGLAVISRSLVRIRFDGNLFESFQRSSEVIGGH